MSYVPKYHTADEIEKSLISDKTSRIRFLRRPELSFGCVAYLLPHEIEELR